MVHKRCMLVINSHYGWEGEIYGQWDVIWERIGLGKMRILNNFVCKIFEHKNLKDQKFVEL